MPLPTQAPTRIILPSAYPPCLCSLSLPHASHPVYILPRPRRFTWCMGSRRLSVSPLPIWSITAPTPPVHPTAIHPPDTNTGGVRFRLYVSRPSCLRQQCEEC